MKWREQTRLRRGQMTQVETIDCSRRDELRYYSPFEGAGGGSRRAINGCTKRGFWFRRYYRP